MTATAARAGVGIARARCTLLLRVTATLLLLGMSACSLQPEQTSPPPPAPPEAPVPSEAERWQQRLDTLNALREWRLRGKVGYRLPDDAGSASLHWRQSGEQSDLRLSGPLGTGSTQIRNEGALLRVTRDGIARLYPADAAPWLGSGTLLPVPLDSIRHWLKGAPDPDQPIDSLVLADALALEITQAGWTIRFDDYRDSRGLALPARLTLDSAEADLRLTVILREWELVPDPGTP